MQYVCILGTWAAGTTEVKLNKKAQNLKGKKKKKGSSSADKPPEPTDLIGYLGVNRTFVMAEKSGETSLLLLLFIFIATE